MGAFVETVKPRQGFEHCGRIIRDEDLLMVYIDAVGKFSISGVILTTVLQGLGEGLISGPIQGVVRLSESGKGLYMDIGGISYAIPVARVRAVMKGEQRKGPVSRVR
ncbi:MAG TPA: hypothetical protein VN429_07450 [Methanospirillum sp.]|uniref:hypothetical protein n=1 Tax=Methanospirillum sp. TaxID=45200 RepID=UPI002C424765|nr:hypothetical protein [Methanospirillum sp.]HWQ64236.1 hypothetical protein [Methanospirillum sp.]